MERCNASGRYSLARFHGHAAAKVNTEYENVGRNDLCPCGSGKKFKKCHGA